MKATEALAVRCRNMNFMEKAFTVLREARTNKALNSIMAIGGLERIVFF